MPVLRHKTAISRTDFSRPMRLALDHGLISEGTKVFDYGCGKGDDIRLLEERGIRLFTDDRNAAALKQAAGRDQSLPGYLKAHLNRLTAGDYCALLAYIERNDVHQEQLQAMRHAIRDAKRVATCLGFGPRFLHSTGQAYKGGPNTGVFLQITCDDAADLTVPGQKYTFGVVKTAQARGDFEVLAARERRALRVHLGPDVRAGLTKLHDIVQSAVG